MLDSILRVDSLRVNPCHAQRAMPKQALQIEEIQPVVDGLTGKGVRPDWGKTAVTLFFAIQTAGTTSGLHPPRPRYEQGPASEGLGRRGTQPGAIQGAAAAPVLNASRDCPLMSRPGAEALLALHEDVVSDASHQAQEHTVEVAGGPEVRRVRPHRQALATSKLVRLHS